MADAEKRRLGTLRFSIYLSHRKEIGFRIWPTDSPKCRLNSQIRRKIPILEIRSECSLISTAFRGESLRHHLNGQGEKSDVLFHRWHSLCPAVLVRFF